MSLNPTEEDAQDRSSKLRHDPNYYALSLIAHIKKMCTTWSVKLESQVFRFSLNSICCFTLMELPMQNCRAAFWTFHKHQPLKALRCHSSAHTLHLGWGGGVYKVSTCSVEVIQLSLSKHHTASPCWATGINLFTCRGASWWTQSVLGATLMHHRHPKRELSDMQLLSELFG